INSGDYYEIFVRNLSANDCRYAVYNLMYKANNGCMRRMSLFYLWIPESAKVKSKIICTSFMKIFADKLYSVSLVVEASREKELSYDAVRDNILFRLH
ncbi:actin-depolymerizing factor homology domain-containing protein, partial [Coemansia spiralis]